MGAYKPDVGSLLGPIFSGMLTSVSGTGRAAWMLTCFAGVACCGLAFSSGRPDRKPMLMLTGITSAMRALQGMNASTGRVR